VNHVTGGANLSRQGFVTCVALPRCHTSSPIWNLDVTEGERHAEPRSPPCRTPWSPHDRIVLAQGLCCPAGRRADRCRHCPGRPRRRGQGCHRLEGLAGGCRARRRIDPGPRPAGSVHCGHSEGAPTRVVEDWCRKSDNKDSQNGEPTTGPTLHFPDRARPRVTSNAPATTAP